MKRLILAIALASTAQTAAADPGRLDRWGCHYNWAGVYHCHEQYTVTRPQRPHNHNHVHRPQPQVNIDAGTAAAILLLGLVLQDSNK